MSSQGANATQTQIIAHAVARTNDIVLLMGVNLSYVSSHNNNINYNIIKNI